MFEIKQIFFVVKCFDNRTIPTPVKAITGVMCNGVAYLSTGSELEDGFGERQRKGRGTLLKDELQL